MKAFVTGGTGAELIRGDMEDVPTTDLVPGRAAA